MSINNISIARVLYQIERAAVRICMQCYLCNTRQLFFFRKNGYDLYRCPSCGLIRTDLQKHYASFLKSFYKHGYFHGQESCSAYVDYGKDKPFVIKNMQTILSRIPKTRGKLLDVGCAYGYFLELALSYGFDAYGFDASRYAVTQAAPHIKKRIRVGTLTTVSYPKESFDVITLFDVIEHLQDPVADLRKLRSYLKSGGVIVIATGDTNSLLSNILRKRWTFYNPPQHLFFFTTHTIEEVLHRAELTPVETFRIGKWVSLSYVLHLAKVSSGSGLAAFLIPIIKTLRLGAIPLYLPIQDNMVIIARKSVKKK